MRSKFRLIFALLLSLSVTAGAAEDWAKTMLEKSPRHGEWVKIQQGKRQLQAFVVYPEIKEKATAVLVIHEIFGLSDWARLTADQLAEAGYIAVAPDLLSEMGPDGGGTDKLGGVDAVRKAISSLPPDQITADLNACVDYIGKLPACNGKIAVAGFCWGGGQSFRFATNNQTIKSAFVFYGTGPEQPAEIARIQCPVYGFYAGNDARVGATVPKSVELMKQAGKTYDPVTYEGAGHGFMRAGLAPDSNDGNKKAQNDAWKRLTELLRQPERNK